MPAVGRSTDHCCFGGPAVMQEVHWRERTKSFTVWANGQVYYFYLVLLPFYESKIVLSAESCQTFIRFFSVQDNSPLCSIISRSWVWCLGWYASFQRQVRCITSVWAPQYHNIIIAVIWIKKGCKSRLCSLVSMTNCTALFYPSIFANGVSTPPLYVLPFT